MKLIELIKLVFMNIVSNKSKGLLTSLGIVVGSATIVLVIAIGQGGKEDVAEQFKNLNAGSIEITVGQSADTIMEQFMDQGGGMFGGSGRDMSDMGGGNMPDMGGGSMPDMGNMPGGSGGGNMPGMRENNSGSRNSSSGRGSSLGGGFNMSGLRGTELTTDDVEDILTIVPNVESASILASNTAAVSGGELEEETEYTAAGVQAEYAMISNLSVLYGEFFTEDDNYNKTKVCVLGYTSAQEIFGAAYLALGDIVTIEGKNYEVIGVLAQMGSVSSGLSPDETIYLPYETATKYVFSSDVSPRITAVASDVNAVETVMENIETVLTENYPDAVFTITDAGSKMEAASSSANTLSMLLISVAIIVFVVGGIGIMNVLFVTVKERTQEIGILKALGCRKSPTVKCQ